MTRIEVGTVSRPHGVRGELRVHLHDPQSRTLLGIDRVFIGGVEMRVKQSRSNNEAILLTVEGVTDRDVAARLAGQSVEVLRAAVPLDANEFFVADLVGCEVVDEAGQSIGRVKHIMHGAQDLLVIHSDTVERFLPAVPEFIVDVDIEAKRVVVVLPEGLPEEPL